jgi:hypothetical protein
MSSRIAARLGRTRQRVERAARNGRSAGGPLKLGPLRADTMGANL